MSHNIPEIEKIKQLKAFNSPFGLIKKAFSSIGILLLIISGLIINWILAIVYIFGWFSGTGWIAYLLSIIALVAIFPAGYFLSAYWYGQTLLFWEAYREIVRPAAARIFSGTLDQMLVKAEGQEELTESEIVAELENRSKHFVEKLPDFIRAYFQVFITGKDVVKLIQKQRAAGKDSEAVKNKAMLSMFEALDLQMSELIEPSMIPFYIVGAINVICWWFMF